MLLYLYVHHFPIRFEVANLAAVLERLETSPSALTCVWIKQHYIGTIDGHFFIYDAPSNPAIRIGFRVPLNHVDVFHYNPSAGEHAQHGAAPALVFAGDHRNFITLPDSIHDAKFCGLNLTYNTSGAREIIFIKRSLRNSRVTGPKIRVPMGCN